MITWTLINIAVAFYIGITTSSYVRSVIKKKWKGKNNLTKKDGILAYFDSQLIFPYLMFPFACTAVVMITGYLIEQIAGISARRIHFTVVPYDLWSVFFFYMFIIMIISAITINIYIVSTMDNYENVVS